MEDFMSAANSRFDYERDTREAIRSHWILVLIEGLILAVLGVLALAEPMIASVAVTIFAGWLFLVGGAIGLIGVFTAHRVPGFWWGLITALLSLAAGVYLLWQPLAGTLSLTLVVAAFFAAEGVLQIIFAAGHRNVIDSWIWMAVAGVANLILAAILFSGWPGTAAWALGILFGINLLMWGLALVMTALACRAVAPARRPARALG
jgi:uncharacterized membrane protein HdeD (DUF308 family)